MSKKKNQEAKAEPIATKNKRYMDVWVDLTDDEIKDRHKNACGDLQVLIEQGNAAVDELKEQIKAKQAEIKSNEDKQQAVMREARDKKVLSSVLVEETWDWNDKTITIKRMDRTVISTRHMTTDEASTLPLSTGE